MPFAVEPRVPSARKDRVVVTAAGGDTLVYDQDTQALHTLNAVASDIWQLCDGQQTASSIGAATGYDDEIVKRALSQLDDAGLLEAPLAPSLRSGESRRSFTKKVGVAAAIPVIVSVTAPMAARAESCPYDLPACQATTEGQACYNGPGEECGICTRATTYYFANGQFQDCSTAEECPPSHPLCMADSGSTTRCGRYVFYCA